MYTLLKIPFVLKAISEAMGGTMTGDVAIGKLCHIMQNR